MELAQMGKRAPNLHISRWVQGGPTNIDEEVARHNAVVVEVFQVNCPGCFTNGLPGAIGIYNKYHRKNVTVLGVATAFEDFDKNTVENLELLLTSGKVIGSTLERLRLLDNDTRELFADANPDSEAKKAKEEVMEWLSGSELLRPDKFDDKSIEDEIAKGIFLRNGNRLKYKIPFPVAFDDVVMARDLVDDEKFKTLLKSAFPGIDAFTEDEKARRAEELRAYIEEERIPKTFRAFQLRGTPSTILIDSNGVLVETIFGNDKNLESKVERLIKR